MAGVTEICQDFLRHLFTQKGAGRFLVGKGFDEVVDLVDIGVFDRLLKQLFRGFCPFLEELLAKFTFIPAFELFF